MNQIEKKEEKKYYKRHETFVKIFKEKVESSHFSKIVRWFYFGNCWEKVEGKRIFNYEKAYYTPYKEFVYKKFLKWQRKIEKNGVKHLDTTYILYKNYKSRPFTFIGKLRNLKRKPLICTFDYFDIENFLINKLTIAGLYSFMFGHSTISKYLGHEMWTARKMLLDAINYEEKQYYLARCRFREKFGVDYYGYLENSAANYIKKNFPELQGKTAEEEIRYKTLEMKDYWNSLYLNSETLTNIEIESKKLIKKAFAYIAINYNKWWD